MNIPLGETVALRVVGFSARDAGFIDNVLGTSLGGGFDNAEFVEDDINDVEYMGGRAALRWFPNENWTVDGSVVYQQMDANSYPEEDVFTEGYDQHPELEGRELAVVRFVDESRSDEWTQLALTLQGDIGPTQFTSATSYFTRRIAYFQDNTDYTFYVSHTFRRELRHLRPRAGSRRPRLARRAVRGPHRPGIPPPGLDREAHLGDGPLLREGRGRLQLLQPHRGLRGHCRLSRPGRTTPSTTALTPWNPARPTTRSIIRRTTR